MGPGPGLHNTPYAAFLHRDFRLLQVARFLTTFGLQMQSVALGWLVYDLTHQPLDLGLVGLAQFVPSASLSLLAGDVVDRVDRRRVIVACHVAYVAIALLLAYLARRPTLGT